MKKIILKFTHDGSPTFEDFYKNKLDEYSDAELETMVKCLSAMVDSGDIWFRHMEKIDNVNHITYILDSDAALTTFQTARDILEADDDHIESIVEEITFEDFANFATNNEEPIIAHERKDAILGS